MRKSRFTEEQIIRIVKSVEGGMPVADAVRQFGISRNTIFLWKKKYKGLGVAEAKRLKALEGSCNRSAHVRNSRLRLQAAQSRTAGRQTGLDRQDWL